MLRRSASLLCLSLFLTAASGVAPGTADASVRPEVRKLFDLSGLDYQLNAVAPQMLSGVEQSISKATPELEQRIRVVVHEQFADRPLHASTLQALEDEWDADYGREAIKWLTSDLGKRITHLEKISSSDKGLANMANFKEPTGNDSQVTQRKALCNRLKESIGGTDYAVDTNMAITLAMAHGANAASPAAGRMTPQQIQQFVEFGRGLLYEDLDAYLDIYFLFTYDDLNQDELRAYIDFMESDAGQWYINTVKNAYVGSLLDLSVELGARLHEAVNGNAVVLEL